MKIEDYLHLYWNCDCVTIAPDKIEHAIHEKINSYWIDRAGRDGTILKPILRKLSDMTEEEASYISPAAWEGKPTIIVNADMTRYLLSKHFDLFNLIENGLAIDINNPS